MMFAADDSSRFWCLILKSIWQKSLFDSVVLFWRVAEVSRDRRFTRGGSIVKAAALLEYTPRHHLMFHCPGVLLSHRLRSPASTELPTDQMPRTCIACYTPGRVPLPDGPTGRSGQPRERSRTFWEQTEGLQWEEVSRLRRHRWLIRGWEADHRLHLRRIHARLLSHFQPLQTFLCRQILHLQNEDSAPSASRKRLGSVGMLGIGIVLQGIDHSRN